ncbi:MAG: response regulator [Proteobacteria bacterium]|nr:response regulator [Pseudomonadota bacterium]
MNPLHDTNEDSQLPPNTPLERTSIDEYVGRKLRYFRESVGLTLNECSERVGVSHQQIHKYEVGQTKIPTGMLYKFCQLFSITPNVFFEGYTNSAEEDHSENKDLISSPSLEKINILLVEDNAEDQFLIRRALEEYDVKVNIYCIHDGDEFINIIIRRSSLTKIPLPDLIFLDLNMPRIDGIATLKALKQSKELRHIPVIVLTGSISIKDVMNSYKNYASGYIRKSFEYESLKKQLHSVINYWTEGVILPHHAWVGAT